MISCKKATEFISRSLEEQLSVKEQLLLKMHLFLCETCELFRKQSALLRDTISRRKDKLEEGPPLSNEAKEKLRRIVSE